MHSLIENYLFLGCLDCCQTVKQAFKIYYVFYKTDKLLVNQEIKINLKPIYHQSVLQPYYAVI